MQSIILLVVMLGVFYAVMLLPQRRQQKKKMELLNSIQPGAKILTQTGFYGRVCEIRDDVLLVELAQGVEVEMDKRAVLRVVERADEVVHAVQE